MSGLFLFLGLFLLVENELLRGSINLLVICVAILFGKMSFEIFQNRWYQLSTEEINRIRSFHGWFESFKQIGQSCVLLVSGLKNFFINLTTKSEKPPKEKKWVRPEFKEVKKQAFDLNGSFDSNKLINQESSENEGTS